MTVIEAVITINSSVDKVWELVADLDNEPKFWKGTKSVRTTSKEGNTIKREIIIAFRDSKCMQTITMQPKQRILVTFTEGIVNGTKTMQLIPEGEKTKLETIWDIKMTGMLGMFTGMVKKHIKNGTEQALESIKQEIEKQV
jgi:carbon monoxide dehydrogenase subunit G